jgi:hypothetical protein
MDDRELKIECLKVAKQNTGDFEATEIVAAACTFYNWVKSARAADNCRDPSRPEDNPHTS